MRSELSFFSILGANDSFHFALSKDLREIVALLEYHGYYIPLAMLDWTEFGTSIGR